MITLEDMELQGTTLQPRPISLRTIHRLYSGWQHGKFGNKSLQEVWQNKLNTHIKYWQPRYASAMQNRLIRLKLTWSYSGTDSYNYSVEFRQNRSKVCKSVRPLPAGVSFEADLGSLLQKYALAYNAEFNRSALGKIPFVGSIVLYSIPML